MKLDIPVGCTIFPGDVLQSPKVWSERTFSNLIYWNRAERGGYFAAFEQPTIFVREVRGPFLDSFRVAGEIPERSTPNRPSTDPRFASPANGGRNGVGVTFVISPAEFLAGNS